MTNLDVNNSTTDSSSDTTSDSSSSASSSSSSSPSSSSDSDSSASHDDAPIVPPSPSRPAPSPINNNKDDYITKKIDRTRRASIKAKPSSSSDSDIQIKEVIRTPPRRRASIKRTTTITNNKTNSNSKPTNRTQTGNKTPKQTPKKEPQRTTRSETRNSTLNIKKKSIFSPDNSSESDSEDKSKSSSKSSNNSKISSKSSNNSKISTHSNISSSNSNNNNKPSPKSTSILRSKSRTRTSSSDKLSTPEKKVLRNHKDINNVKRRSGSRTNGPPPKKSVEDKITTTSSSSSQSSSDLDTPSSDSSSSKKESIKSNKTNKTTTSSSSLSKSTSSNTSIASTTSNSKTIEAILRLEAEATLEGTGAVPRKLTRSLSARVSRLAAATKVTHTDTDSEIDEKPDYMTDLLKKGNRKLIRSPILPLTPPEPPEPQERRCPVRGCDSLGHLGGLSSKHFTWDACPLYHNVSAAWCVAAEEERGAAGIARRKAAQAMVQRPRAQPTIEQRAYQLKVKDMRSKWKGSDDRPPECSTSEELSIDREPSLDGFAPDYDLRLFREAQALAAIKIEEELGDLPTDRGTRYVVMGKYMMEVWYQSPYPGDAARVPRLFVCEFCLQHQQSKAGASRHTSKCLWRHPPGDEVYRKDNLSVWQVDGRKHKQYCQQLCLLAKFFLDHKTLYYDVEPFLFYVMTLADTEGCHVVGYFSKEKNSFLNYNVSCILTLPPYQRQGYGRLLIDFSYLLTKVEGKVGSPETPLSDLGLISYRSYWKEALLRRLCSASGPSLSIRDLSKDLGIASCDIVSTLQERGLMKYWKGKHIVLKKQEVLEEMSRRSDRARCVDPSCLRWSPPAPPPPR